MNEMSTLKAKLKDQNQRLIVLSQEKLRLEAKNKLNQSSTDAAAQEQAKIALNNKQIALKQLREKLEEMEKEVSFRYCMSKVLYASKRKFFLVIERRK